MKGCNPSLLSPLHCWVPTFVSLKDDYEFPRWLLQRLPGTWKLTYSRAWTSASEAFYFALYKCAHHHYYYETHNHMDAATLCVGVQWVGQTWARAPSSRSSCLACSSAGPTDATRPSSRAAWRCLVVGRSTWCIAGSSRYSAAASAGTPTDTWPSCRAVSQPRRCRLRRVPLYRDNEFHCRLQHVISSVTCQ